MYRDLGRCYWCLIDQGFSKDNIRVLSASRMSDVLAATKQTALYFGDRNGFCVWNESAGKTFREDIVTDQGLGDQVELLLEGNSSVSYKLNPNDALLLFFFGHGETNGSLVLGCDQQLKPQTLRDLIQSLERKCRVGTYLASCYSGKVVDKLPDSMSQAYVSAAAKKEAWSFEQSGSGQFYGGAFMQAITQLLGKRTMKVPQHLQEVTSKVNNMVSDRVQEGAYIYSPTLSNTEIERFFGALDTQSPSSSTSAASSAGTSPSPNKKRRHASSRKWYITSQGPTNYLATLALPFPITLPPLPLQTPSAVSNNFKRPAPADIGIVQSYVRKDQAVDDASEWNEDFQEQLIERHAIIVAWAEICLALYRQGTISLEVFRQMFEDPHELDNDEVDKLESCIDLVDALDEGLTRDSSGPPYTLYVYWGLKVLAESGVTVVDLDHVLQDRKWAWSMSEFARTTYHAQ